MNNSLSTVGNPINDQNRNVVITINDVWPEHVAAMKKLSKKLSRNLRGIVIIDKHVRDNNFNVKNDPENLFTEIVCDFSDPSDIRAATSQFERQVLLISCTSERNQPFFKQIIPYLPLANAPSESSIDWATQKSEMREMLDSYDTSLTPRYLYIDNLSNIQNSVNLVVNTLHFPLIVKPNGLAASILVKKCSDETELRQGLQAITEEIHAVYKRDKGRGKPGIMVEEFIDGEMYSVDAYADNEGRVWSLPACLVTTAASIGLEGYYSYRIDTAIDLSPEEVSSLEITVKKAVHALSLRSCVAHVEVFRIANGWKVIELAPRPGGYRQDIYWLAYGIDHMYNEFLTKIGLEPEITDKTKAYAAVLNIYADKEGIIESIEGLEQAKQCKSVEYLEQYLFPGDKAVYCGNGGKYIVDGVISNESRQQLDTDFDSIRQAIKINLKANEGDHE